MLIDKRKWLIISVILVWICLISTDYTNVIKQKEPLFMLKVKVSEQIFYAIGLGTFAEYSVGIYEPNIGEVAYEEFYLFFMNVFHSNP